MKTIAQLKELAGTVEGDLWKPRLDVDFFANGREPGWYWRDLAESPSDQWRGPFVSARDAWLAALDEYGVKP